MAHNGLVATGYYNYLSLENSERSELPRVISFECPDNRPIRTPIKTTIYIGPTMLVTTVIICAAGKSGLMSPKPKVVKQTKA